MYQHPKGKPDPGEVGLFMFFAWFPILVIGLISLLFDILGWMFEQWWFYVFLFLCVVFALISPVFIK